MVKDNYLFYFEHGSSQISAVQGSVSQPPSLIMRYSQRCPLSVSSCQFEGSEAIVLLVDHFSDTILHMYNFKRTPVLYSIALCVITDSPTLSHKGYKQKRESNFTSRMSGQCGVFSSKFRCVQLTHVQSGSFDHPILTMYNEEPKFFFFSRQGRGFSQ